MWTTWTQLPCHIEADPTLETNKTRIICSLNHMFRATMHVMQGTTQVAPTIFTWWRGASSMKRIIHHGPKYYFGSMGKDILIKAQSLDNLSLSLSLSLVGCEIPTKWDPQTLHMIWKVLIGNSLEVNCKVDGPNRVNVKKIFCFTTPTWGIVKTCIV